MIGAFHLFQVSFDSIEVHHNIRFNDRDEGGLIWGSSKITIIE